MSGITTLDSVFGTARCSRSRPPRWPLSRGARLAANPPEIHKRGVVLKDTQRRRRRIARGAAPSSLTLAGVALAAADETKHFKLLGTTGTGKSTAIRELLGAAIDRGDRAVFADPDGGYLGRFHDRYRGDIVLNPFEEASVKWDLFAEIQNSYDVEQLASGLIPTSEDPSASEWRGYARTFLAPWCGAATFAARRTWRSVEVAGHSFGGGVAAHSSQARPRSLFSTRITPACSARFAR